MVVSQPDLVQEPSDDIPAMLSDGEFVMTLLLTTERVDLNLTKQKKGIELIAASKPNRKKRC